MGNLKVLHVCNDFSGSPVYKNLISALDNLDVHQIVYNPIRDPGREGKNRIHLKSQESRILYSTILNRVSDRLFYRHKIHKIARDLKSKVDFSSIDVIHAHTWYSDGGVAYLLSKEYGIPYIVTIRNTDLNVFQKYLLHERNFGQKILNAAKDVVLISASYRSRVLALPSLSSIRELLNNKLHVVPNGVDSYWIENACQKKNKSSSFFNVLFIGKFTRGKNVLNLQKAINIINKGQEQAVHLHLIGGGGNVHDEVLAFVKQNPKTMFFHGEVRDQDRLKEYFEQADIFAMPSKYETFGLVYVEALMQGLPILYTANEGIDGFYNENIGEKVESGDVDEIVFKLQEMIKNYASYVIPTKKIMKNHDWTEIALVYQKIYK